MPTTLERWHRGGHRIAFSCADVEFTQFCAADTRTLYDIRNDPTVRPFMPSSEPLPYERHLDWVETQLLAGHAASPLIVIGRAAGQAVAFGILKAGPDAGVFEPGVIVIGSRQRSTLPARLGAAMFTIAARLFGAHTLVTHVNRHNRQSLRLNEGSGLVATADSHKPGEILFRTPIQVLLSTPIYRRCAARLALHIEP